MDPMVEDILAKFENCSDYYNWDDRERLCHLHSSFEGLAHQVLWDAGQQSSVDEVIKLLKNRFGSLNEEKDIALNSKLVNIVKVSCYSQCTRTFDA